MNSLARRAFAGFILAVFGFSGCALNGVVTDISDQQSNLRGIHLKEGKYLVVYDGNGIRHVPLSSIQQLSVSSQRSRVIDGSLFYSANITFSGGGQSLGSRRGGVFDNRSVFVCVADIVCGTNGKTGVCIPLDRISVIRIADQ